MQKVLNLLLSVIAFTFFSVLALTAPTFGEPAARVQAILISWEENPILFIDTREQQLSFGGQSVRLICAVDGTDEVIAEVDGVFFALNGTAKDYIRRGLWVVVDGDRQTVVSDHQSMQLGGALNRYTNTIIGVGRKLCGFDLRPISGGIQRAIRLRKEGEETYRRNAVRLGLPTRNSK